MESRRHSCAYAQEGPAEGPGARQKVAQERDAGPDAGISIYCGRRRARRKGSENNGGGASKGRSAEGSPKPDDKSASDRTTGEEKKSLKSTVGRRLPRLGLRSGAVGGHRNRSAAAPAANPSIVTAAIGVPKKLGFDSGDSNERFAKPPD